MFFLNIILLLVLPAMLNAFWINHEQYVTFSPIYNWGIKIRDGANPPYIFFIPFVFSYLTSAISFLFREKGIFIFKCTIYLILIVVYAINIFTLFNFSTMISPAIVMLMTETNSGETYEFLKTYMTNKDSLLSYSIIAITIIYIILSECRIKSTIKNKYLLILFFVISIYMFQRSIEPINAFCRLFKCRNLTETELWYLTYPVNTNTLSNLIYSTYSLHLSKQEMVKATQSTISVTDIITIKRAINLIVIIGESYSKHHSSLYGYRLNTTPLLNNHVKSGQLFVFNNVISPYNLTSFVLRNLFSVNSIMDGENWADYPAFPFLFKKAGYNVYFWDNQRTFGKADVSDFSVASFLFNDDITKASYSKFNKSTFSFDGDLIKDFFNNVSFKGNNNLLIFHLMGQHTMPEKRYPHIKQFNVFSKDSISRDDLDDRRKTLIANYDNATLYNDYVIDTIIKQFSNDNAVILYFSDHGEEIYDFRDHYGRTQEAEKTIDHLKYQYEIPFMIWCSKNFIKEFPNIAKDIDASVDKPFMNDNICQILFGLVDMDTKYYHEERNLISPNFKPYEQRFVQGTINFDKIRWSKIK